MTFSESFGSRHCAADGHLFSNVNLGHAQTPTEKVKSKTEKQHYRFGCELAWKKILEHNFPTAFARTFTCFRSLVFESKHISSQKFN